MWNTLLIQNIVIVYVPDLIDCGVFYFRWSDFEKVEPVPAAGIEKLITVEWLGSRDRENHMHQRVGRLW